MMFSIALLLVFGYLAFRVAPREREEDAHIHGKGQIGVLAALALFGVDYATSYYYATGEMMSALHPYGLQQYSYIVVGVIAFANFAFGALYMYSLGIFNEGGGSYTASMRYLWPSLSLIVAVTLLQDYVLTIVVSSLGGGDQLLSVLNAYDTHWVWHFLIGAVLAGITWYLTIRGRGESAQIVFTLLGIFLMMTVTMGIGLLLAHLKGIPPVASTEAIKSASLGQALFHMLTASMKGMVALTGLEAMSNGIQFVKHEDAGLVRWGKKHLPRWKGVWNFYSGKSGIGRFVQTSFLFYGGLTTLFLTVFSLRFNVFDGTFGRTLVGNLAFIGFEQIPGGIILFWAYQFLAVALLAAASMTAFQDLQSTGWRDVAIGELPEIVVYRNDQGTFTRSVTAGFIATVIIQFLVRGQTSAAIPFYGVGVFMPITAMGLAVRRHIQTHSTGQKRTWGMIAATLVTALAALVFVGQIVGKWNEGGWVVLISFSILILTAHFILLSPAGFRDAEQIRRIVYDKAKVKGSMATIVEWQSLRMQEYRYSFVQRISLNIARFYELFGIHRPLRFEPAPLPSGEYDEAMHIDHPVQPASHPLIEPVMEGLQVGGKPHETSKDDQ
ncbi:MAG: APC family permease [Anaerolineales bacterium]|nr:APC family permease [Anaerolineales bacterium]